MKKLNVFILMCLLVSCSSSPPSDEEIILIIKDSMQKTLPLEVIGYMLGGRLEKLEDIKIEKVQKKTMSPNMFMKALGEKSYEYWAVTARVKGTGRTNEPFGVRGELRGFNARHIWGLKKEENGSWSIIKNEIGLVEQPANPSSWKINENKTTTKKEDHNLTQNTFILEGIVTNKSEKQGSGAFWSFKVKNKEGVEFPFTCSEYNALRFKIDGIDVDSIKGYKHLYDQYKAVRLYISIKSKDYVLNKCKNNGCDGTCPDAIEILSSTD